MRLNIRHSFRIVLALLVLALAFGPVSSAQAASANNNVEWNGVGHAPGSNVCGDSVFPYRYPLNPNADKNVYIRGRVYTGDLTGLKVWYTIDPAADAQADWSSVSASWEANWWGCGGLGDMDIWTAQIPKQNSRVWYKLEFIDGTDSDWVRASGEGSGAVSEDEGGWTNASTSLTYEPPATVYVDDGFTPSTPGYDYDHFSTLQDGVDAVGTGGLVDVADGSYTTVLINKSLTLDGASADTVILSGACANGMIEVSAGTVTVKDLRINVSETAPCTTGIYVSGGALTAQTNKLIGVDEEITYGFRIVGGTLTAEGNVLQYFNRGVYATAGTVTIGGDIWGEQNLIDSNLTGVYVSGTAAVTVKGNVISKNYRAFSQNSGTLNAYANSVTGFSYARTLSGGTTALKHNYWGTNAADAAMFSGLTADDWKTRLAAPISDWVEGSTSLSFSGASITGAGALQIVSHGAGSTNANRPFGNGIEPYASQMCSSFFDVFVVGGSGTYDVGVDVNNVVDCDPRLVDQALYWIPVDTIYATECSGADNTNCWDGVKKTKTVTTNGRTLQVSGLSLAEVGGTQFVVGDINGMDPTAVQMVSLEAHSVAGLPWGWLAVALGVTGLLAAALVLSKRK